MSHPCFEPRRRQLAPLLVGLGIAGALPRAARAAEMITEWKRPQVRVRERPDGDAFRIPASELPRPAEVKDRTLDGQLKFLDRQGRALFVSRTDVETTGTAAPSGTNVSDLCPAAPSDPTKMTGTVAQRAAPRPTVGQGMGGGKRC